MYECKIKELSPDELVLLANRILEKSEWVQGSIEGSPCRKWCGTLGRHGQGQIGLLHKGKLKKFLVHRIMREWEHGDISTGPCVLHTCREPACTIHLKIGDQPENMDDRERDGNTAKGERSGRAVLTTEIAEEALKMIAEGESISFTAEYLGVGRRAIQRLAWGETYLAVPGERIPPKEAVPTSRYRGVFYRKDRRRWRAQLTVRGAVLFLGSFHTEIEAAQAYNNAVLERGLDYPPNDVPAGNPQRLPPSSGPPLTNDQIVEIKRLYAAGFCSQRKIAEQVGVSEAIVSKIVHEERSVVERPLNRRADHE